MKPDVPASTRNEALFHCAIPSGVPRGPSQIHSIPDSQRHPQKFSAVTGTSRVNPGFPAAFWARPRETFFTASWGPIPYHDWRAMTHFPRHAHWNLTSLAPHERLPALPVLPHENPTLAPPLEKTHETPPSSRAEDLLFLHGLESNPGSSGKGQRLHDPWKVKTGFSQAENGRFWRLSAETGSCS